MSNKELVRSIKSEYNLTLNDTIGILAKISKAVEGMENPFIPNGLPVEKVGFEFCRQDFLKLLKG